MDYQACVSGSLSRPAGAADKGIGGACFRMTVRRTPIARRQEPASERLKGVYSKATIRELTPALTEEDP